MHKVTIQLEVKPMVSMFRRLPFSVREEVAQELSRLLLEDIIQRIDASEWAPPIVALKKKSGKIRPCVDLQVPNKAVVVDRFPLPHTAEQYTLRM